MGNLAVQVEGIGKQYQLGLREKANQTFREAIVGIASAPLRRLKQLSGREEESKFWALRDISFDVPEGEVLGIIGHNGAGKSTLLKILSRITEPTEGRATIHGRVASLLEVGTGFHNELSGRENVYLNGAILGMSKAEINRKFDEIVDFSGVERFLDTPIKRYSSGMKVRLAFAVAAHLEPEILIIDEVLAVGDQEFQNKCLGKMQDVATSGRTVLFVSHNMAAVESLCSRVALLFDGKVKGIADPESGIRDYLRSSTSNAESGFVDLVNHPQRCGNTGLPVLRSLLLTDQSGQATQAVAVGGTIEFHIHAEPDHALYSPALCITLYDHFGSRVTTLHTDYQMQGLKEVSGPTKLCCRLTNCRLAPGAYTVGMYITSHGVSTDRIDKVLNIEVFAADIYGSGKSLPRKAGVYIPEATWSVSATVGSDSEGFH